MTAPTNNTRSRRRLVAAGGSVAFAFAAAATPQALAGGHQAALVVNSTADSRDAAPGDGRCADDEGRCTLRAAVDEANAMAGTDTIRLRALTYTLTMPGGAEDGNASGDLDVLDDLHLQGWGATIDAAGLDRAVDVAVDVALHLDNVTVIGGRAPEGESGGAVRSAGRAHIARSILRDNHVAGAGASGGAVMNDAGRLTIERSRLQGNSATRAGGAIEANAGHTSLSQVALHDNHTGAMPGNGGGLHLTGAGTVRVVASTVTANTASAEGGGLWNSATGSMSVERTHLEGNVASGDDPDMGGGGLFNDGGELVVDRSTIVGNVADGVSGSGGGILNDGGTLVVTGTQLRGNDAVRAGGGIEADAGSTTLDRVALLGNTTGANPGNGGGFHLTGAGTVAVSRSTVVGNDAAAEGGGLWNSATGTMVVTSTALRANTAPVGPDVFNDGGTFTVDGTPVPVG